MLSSSEIERQPGQKDRGRKNKMFVSRQDNEESKLTFHAQIHEEFHECVKI